MSQRDYAYVQALNALQVNPLMHASYTEFLRQTKGENYLYNLLKKSTITKRMNLNQRQKRKMWANNPNLRNKR
jgi:phage terminase large subunit-like protein